MVLDVVMVPAIGPGGMVDAAPERRKRVEDHLFDVYPVQKVNVRWREPLRFATRTSASAGFQALPWPAPATGAGPATYYHLLLAKEDSTEGYLGIANLAGATMNDGAPAHRHHLRRAAGGRQPAGHHLARDGPQPRPQPRPRLQRPGVDMNFPYSPAPGHRRERLLAERDER